jgi:hypothetical protein
VLAASQGHPKLLQLADAHIADPTRLADLTTAADTVWSGAGHLPEDFFTTGKTSAQPGDYLQVLHLWTARTVDTLTLGGFLAVSSGFGDQVSVVPAWRVDEGVIVSLAA